MKYFILSIFSLFSTFQFFLAEEGMLIPSLISAFESDMKAKGMKLSAKDIYDVNHASIKDAIMHFGGGCTAEIVSSKGLLLTNHHCGYGQIQAHSSLEKDYLKNGFWAKSLAEELPNPGLTASRMVRIEDVTSSVFFGISASDSEMDKSKKIQANIAKLIEDAKIGNNYEAEIDPFNYGNDYYMIVKEIFKDVRLVGTPPNSIGKFGGDTDNWVWPRHTGDFSVFRIYASAGNTPAEYSKDNVPYSPLHYLPISFKDRKKNDFTMVYGFPGQTEQHVSSAYLQFIIEKERPARILMRQKSLSVIDAGMRSSDAIRIQYSAKQARIANAYKKWIGQIDGLKNLGAVQIKKNQESAYNKQALTNDSWNQKYGKIIPSLNALVESKVQYEFQYAMGIEYFFVGPEFFKLIKGLEDVSRNALKYESEGVFKSKIETLKTNAKGFFKDYNSGIDQQIFELLTEEYLKQINKEDLKAFAGDMKSLSKKLYTKSALTSEDRYMAFLDKLKAKTALKQFNKDAGVFFYQHLMNDFRTNVVGQYQSFTAEMTGLLKTFVAGKYEMFPDAKHWPDANSTLRITYGQLEGSAPTDGMEYTEHTTIDGLIAKHHTGNPDFELLPRMLELYEKKDYGDYGQDGSLWVCFTGSNHTTGGNSGSPCLDENGHLMGLNFDRTWESTMSDYMFDPNRCRNIVVDIRYVLWVMDKYSGAKHLVDEMTLVKN